MPEKSRLDDLLVNRHLASDRNVAMRIIMAGQVRVDGQLVLKPDTALVNEVKIEIDSLPKFVSRGGEKLAAALEAFQIDVSGKVCVDVGASTGGFTDCLLQHGAKTVYAIDVGRGILDWRLRQNPKVIVMESTNARHIEHLPTPVQVATIDVSFISLDIILPVVLDWFKASEYPDLKNHDMGWTVVALIKPQYEASREQVGRGKGVIREPVIHRQILEKVLVSAIRLGFEVKGLTASPLLGPKGNREFLAWLAWPGNVTANLARIIAEAVG